MLIKGSESRWIKWQQICWLLVMLIVNKTTHRPHLTLVMLLVYFQSLTIEVLLMTSWTVFSVWMTGYSLVNRLSQQTKKAKRRKRR